MKMFISFIIFLLFTWTCLWWFYYCNWCRFEKETTEELVFTASEYNAKLRQRDSIESFILHHHFLIRNDMEDIVLTFKSKPLIQKASDSVFLANDLDSLGHKIAHYLIKNPSQELIITGYRTQSEKQDQNNFGLGRANFLQNYLLRFGANPDKLIVNSAIKNFEFDQHNQYTKGINLEFNTISNERLSEIERGIANKLLYAEVGQENFKPDPKLVNYSIELKRFLNKYPLKQLL